MHKLLVANWKANPNSLEQVIELARKTEHATPNSKEVEVIVVPPFPFLLPVGKILKKAKLGAQDVFSENSGPYTGEVTPVMLRILGARNVIIGHSERRKLLGETDEMINRKLKMAVRFLLKPILCVGEPEAVRKMGIDAAKGYVREQLQKDLKNVKFPVTIAYEPVWAIGTGTPDRPEDTVEMVKFIKSMFQKKPAVIYGGSVSEKNAHAFLSRPEIDGALVGGASLKPDEFKKIIQIAQKS